MSAADFFGQQSPFQVVVAVVALITGLYTLYKSFIESANVEISVGDRVGIVISEKPGVAALHLQSSVINKAVKMGILHRLEAKLQTQTGESSTFAWNEFLDWAEGAAQVHKRSEPHPIAVAGKSSIPLFVQLVPFGTERTKWDAGEYTIELIGWANRAKRSDKSNVKSTFHVRLDQSLADRLTRGGQLPPKVEFVPVSEWISTMKEKVYINWNLIGAIPAGLAILAAVVLFYRIDWGFARGDVTDYALECIQAPSANGKSCEHYFQGPVTVYVVDVGKQSVVSQTKGAAPVKLNKCAIIDRENWKCVGEYGNLSTVSYVNGIINLSAGAGSDYYKHVSRSEWLDAPARGK